MVLLHNLAGNQTMSCLYNRQQDMIKKVRADRALAWYPVPHNKCPLSLKYLLSEQHQFNLKCRHAAVPHLSVSRALHLTSTILNNGGAIHCLPGESGTHASHERISIKRYLFALEPCSLIMFFLDVGGIPLVTSSLRRQKSKFIAGCYETIRLSILLSLPSSSPSCVRVPLYLVALYVRITVLPCRAGEL